MQSEAVSYVLGSNTKTRGSSNQKHNLKSRKIRCIQDFDSLNRSSLLRGSDKGVNCMEKTKTKKQHKLDFLPKVDLNSDSKENYIENNSINRSHQGKGMENITPRKSTSTIVQGSFKIGAESCNGILSSWDLSSTFDKDDEVDFKSKQKKKQKNLSKTFNAVDSVKNVSTPDEMPGKSENTKACSSLRKQILQKKQISKNLSKNSLAMSKEVSEEIQNNLKNDCVQIFNSRKFSQNSPSTSFKLLSQITPDKSGNNQGIFDVTYPIEEEYDNPSLVHLSSLELTFEKTNNFQNSDLHSTLDNMQSPSKAILTSQDMGQSVELNDLIRNRRISSGSIINLITPSPKKCALSEKVLSTPTPTKSTPRNTQNSKRGSKSNLHTKGTTSLVRSGTFTKEDESTKVTLNSWEMPNPETSVNVTTSCRKRWTKMLGASVLDNIGNLQPISAPSANDSLLLSPASILPSISYPSKKHISISSPVHLTSSTPITANKNKNDFLKISNKKDIGISIKKTKMPNFAQIHQKAYEKLENIKEMSERKASRAQKLLSGHKPLIGIIKKSPSKSRKALDYNPVQEQIVNRNPVSKLQEVKPLQKMECAKNSSKTVLSKIKTLGEKSCIPVPKHNIKSTMENKIHAKKKSLEKKNIPKFITGTTKPLSKNLPHEKEHLKAIANKKLVLTDTIEKRRKAVQNIRTNRRFELLMQMRKK